jgi:hypothetical protein
MDALFGSVMKGVDIRLKKDVTLRPAHGLPHVWRMLESAVRCAPELDKDELIVTEAWRLPRHPDDAHSWCNAFDLRIHNISGMDPDERVAEAWAWVKRMRADLDDPRYQFDVHGVGGSAHIHMEFDPR